MAGVLFTACLDIPSKPSSSGKATRLAVYVQQESTDDSTSLKLNASEAATLNAHVSPAKFEKELTFYWYMDEDLLGEGSSFSISQPLADDIPNRVIAMDSEGNSLEKEFALELNTPPRIGATFYPEENAKFSITESQTITFKWFVSYVGNGTIESTLFIDDQAYPVGTLTQVEQSGFTPGKHTFHIEVEDSFGDKVSSRERSFTVTEPKEF